VSDDSFGEQKKILTLNILEPKETIICAEGIGLHHHVSNLWYDYQSLSKDAVTLTLKTTNDDTDVQ
jgi:hypothetical protein